MAAKLGKNAAIYLGANKVARMTSLSFTTNRGTADTTEFGDDWESHLSTIGNWTASIDGMFDLSDTQQNTLHSMALSGGEVTDLYLYEDATNYWKSDTDTDTDAMVTIESYTWNADQSGIVTFSMGIKGSGPVTRTS